MASPFLPEILNVSLPFSKSRQLPLSRADKIVNADHDIVHASRRYRPRGDCIAAIDFGTSCLSLAYTTPFYKGETKVLKLYRTYERVPNTILMQQTEGEDGQPRCIVKAIGYEAQEGYSRLGKRKLHEYIYFERIKSLLEREKSVNRNTVVTSFTSGYGLDSSDDSEYYLIEVIAFIIKHLKEKLLAHLEDQLLQCTDFDWVITVPAIWKARARRMMREAAYLAGLTSDDEGIICLTNPKVIRELPRPKEVNPHKLTLALEPEAAAIYAHSYTESLTPPPPDSYMVIDIGGGTVDITVHNRRSSKVADAVLPPIGNVWGGTTVNEALRLMLAELVNDPDHEAFLRHSQEVAQVALNDLYYQEFEREKKKFGENYKRVALDTTNLEEARILLPRSFVDFYSSLKLDKEAEQRGLVFEVGEGHLYIRYDLLEEKTFQVTIDSIIECVRSAIKKLPKKINTIYLVGGFGGCQFVKRKIQEAFARDHGKVYDNIVCPQQADLAVCIGAVLWRQNPDIIQSRIADATYGMSIGPRFDPAIHDKDYMYKDEDGIKRCHNIFEVFVLKGEVIGSNDVYKTGVNPLRQKDTTMIVSIYSTTEEGVQYTKDKEGKPTVQKIGELCIDIPNPDNVPRIERGVEVFMDFSATEIQARARYTITREEVKTVCDFLSYQD